MVLLRLFAVVFQITKKIRSRNTILLPLIIEISKIFLEQLNNTIIDVASYADHRIFNSVVLTHIFLKVLRLHDLKLLLGSQNRLSKRMAAVCSLGN
ncbi:hypothetical protein D3C73_1279110 [compost metagenome]